MTEKIHTVLVVDDEQSILDYLNLGFNYEGFRVLSADDANSALKIVAEERPDIIVLDRMLPQMDGLTLCGKFRERWPDVPILVLSALGRTEQRIEGLKVGADDYLPKPFKFEELLLRVQSLLRRSGKSLDDNSVLSHGALELDTESRRASLQNRVLDLTARECEILEALLRHKGKVLTRDRLITHLWGYDYDGDTKVVDVHVSALRQKLGDDDKSLIRTVRGVGYVLGG